MEFDEILDLNTTTQNWAESIEIESEIKDNRAIIYATIASCNQQSQDILIANYDIDELEADIIEIEGIDGMVIEVNAIHDGEQRDFENDTKPKETIFVVIGIIIFIFLLVTISLFLFILRKKRSQNEKHRETLRKVVESQSAVSRETNDHNHHYPTPVGRPSSQIRDELKEYHTHETQGDTVSPDKQYKQHEICIWLETIGFAQFYEHFINAGYESLDFIRDIKNDSDLMEIGINNAEDRHKILMNIKQLNHDKHEENENGPGNATTDKIKTAGFDEDIPNLGEDAFVIESDDE